MSGALALPAAVIGGAAPASADATVQAVPGYLLNAVACPSASTCMVAGNTNPSNQGVIMPVTYGIPGSIQPVAGTSELSGIACASTATCVAVGNSAPVNQGVVVPITNGVPGSPHTVTGSTDVFGVACPTTTACLAVGRNSSDQGVILPVTNGIPGSVQVVPGTEGFTGVACPSATTCVAVGANSIASTAQGVVVPITNGTPGSVQTVAGTRDFESVACSSATTCVAVGTSPPANSPSATGMVVPVSNGIAGAARAVAGTTILFGVACPGTSTCQAVGYLAGSSAPQGMVVPIASGVPGTAQAVAGTTELFGAACPGATVCEAAGAFAVATFVVAHIYVSLTFDNGAISQYTLGYQQALGPHGIQGTFYINTGVMGGSNHMSWSQLSALTAAGQEIGGKTVDGTNLTTQTASQQIAEICNDRQALISHGLKPAGFAYPAGAFNATIESEVQNCGYGNGRTAGSLSPAGPTYAETVPPKNWLALRAYAPTGQVTLANLESLVNGAASRGGGWVPIVIQKVCSQALDPNNYATCTSSSGWIELADLKTFILWVQSAGQGGYAPAGTMFSTIGATAASADSTAPATTISCNGAPCAATAYGGTVDVTLSATDTGSGVASIHYTTDGSTPTLSSPAYTSAFTLTSSATVQFRAWDNAGNAEAVKVQTIQI